MAGLTKYVQWVWGISVAIQVAICVLLFLRGNSRRVPIFTAYLMSNVCQAVALYVVYYQFGYRSRSAALIAWWSQCIPQLLRVLAISEVLRLVLKPYRGIWRLGWRVLALAFGLVFSVALIGSRHELSWAVLLADRGFHLAFGVALVACLLLVHYYSIPVHPAYRVLLGGFCFYSCTVVLANTIGAMLFLRGNANFQMIWQLVTMSAFVAVLAFWAVALRTPLSEPAQAEVSPETVRAYWEMSPRINERLRLLNNQLDHFWKPEATQ